ncbi:DUF3592 domain-containing protein [Prosthecobacter sp.]|uniref:DUF3592 domain-containing protein n=1 Tax=Prosthecobacter sp. TaxID=1965333 RepID=UPI002AB835BB|nr:DUF3592 domain-containing protein [Prosthecobacter sp.]MDZ4402016.1 DUF3592 domain-containing protein [Prosthecobacter sp.]
MNAFMGYAVFCFFGWLIFRDRRRLMDAWRSRNWQPTKAIVTALKDQVFELDSCGQYSSYVGRHSARFYTFQYCVNGVVHETDCFSFDGPLYTWNRRIVHEHPRLEVGDETVIYFDPADPRRAVILRGFSFNTLIVPLICLYALGWAVWHTI